MFLDSEKPSREFIPNVKKKKCDDQRVGDFVLPTYKSVMNDESDPMKAHFAIELGRSDILDFPMFREPTQTMKEAYLRTALGTTSQISTPQADFSAEIYGDHEDPMSETQRIREYDVAMNDKHVQSIILWLKIVQCYLRDTGIIPEPFQLEMFAHAVFFIASIRAYKFGEVYDLLKACFNITDEQYYKAKSCVFLVMRRNGKTFFTKLIFAAAMISLPEVNLAYYVHHTQLLDTTLSDIEMEMRRMCSLCREVRVKSISYSKGLCKIVTVFHDDVISTLEGRSTSNPDVSFEFFFK